MHLKHIFTFLIFLVTFNSCRVETAKSPSKQTVTIYSDCLSHSDRILFKSFRKKENIKVRIIHLPADTILAHLKKEGVNTNADVVILKSLYDIQRAHKADLFQPWKSWKMDELIDERYKSTDNTWFGIGIDPYVFIAKNDTLSTITTFGQLLHKANKGKWSTNLVTSSELIPMLGPILYKKKRSESLEWYWNFIENQYIQNKITDKKGIPIMMTNILLSNYSSYAEMIKNKDSSDFKMKLVFTNQNKKGAFYNLRTVAIVKQARNFENAKLLVEYICTIHINEILNKRLNTFPISRKNSFHKFDYQNTSFKIFKGSTSKIIVNYPFIDRILKTKVVKRDIDTTQL